MSGGDGVPLPPQLTVLCPAKRKLRQVSKCTSEREYNRMISVTDNISVIICAYTEDRWDNLTAAVESVQRQKFSRFEIIVVIDHNPGLLERAGECLPGVVVVENIKTPGLSGARNSGIAVAKGDI